MENNMPTYGNGKICYLEIPAVDINVPSNFYCKAFGCRLRDQRDGAISFDDGVGQVSGMWVLNKKPMREPGIIISIMVDDAEATKKLVVAHGGTIVHSSDLDSGEVIVNFKDPAGNLMGCTKNPKRNSQKPKMKILSPPKSISVGSGFAKMPGSR